MAKISAGIHRVGGAPVVKSRSLSRKRGRSLAGRARSLAPCPFAGTEPESVYRLSPSFRAKMMERADALCNTVFAGAVTRVLQLEYQVCRGPKGRRGLDRL
jgi:hypothetical protein